MEGLRQITSRHIHASLLNAVGRCQEQGLSFAVWRLPGSTVVHFAASQAPTGTHDVNLEEKKSGFLFAPFDPGEKKMFLPADEYLLFENDEIREQRGSLLTLPVSSKVETRKPYSIAAPSHTPSDHKGYKTLVTFCRDAVRSGQFEKLVPSRCMEVELDEDFDMAETFLELCHHYPSAMVSIFSSPSTGTWIGATPEMLVKVDAGQHFHTAAVAGTQKYEAGTDLGSITWAQKEIEEQALVERYVISCFKKIRLREFDEMGPRTVVAGNVVHLKTEFKVDMVATRYPELGTVMLQLLHPTSAVCGMPMESSLNFLKKNEGYPRQYYSGYLGPMNIENQTELFVNLRCMQMMPSSARLYAGCGVLGDSDPEKEWQETELKMNTLLRVIRD